MDIWQTTQQAVQLLFSGDMALWGIVGVSFSVSLLAISIVLIPALVIGFALAYGKFPGRWLILSLFNTFQSIPTVVIGLLLYMTLSRSGPMGDWKMLFTQQAMIIGQIMICFPILVSMMHAAFQNSDRRAWETA
jgi:tungstate transport system permease protein